MTIRVTIAFEGLPLLDGAAGDRLLAELRTELPDAGPVFAQNQESGRLEITLIGAFGELPLVFGADPVARAVGRAGYGERRWSSIHAEHAVPALD
jgi:hypothetical protein